MFAFFHVVSGSFRLRLSNDLSFPMNRATDRATDWYTSSVLLFFLRGPSSLDFLPPVSSLSFALSLSHFDLHVPCPFLFVPIPAAYYVKTMKSHIVSHCFIWPIHVQHNSCQSILLLHARALSVFLSLSTTAVKALCVLLASSFVLLAPMGGKKRERRMPGTGCDGRGRQRREVEN